MCVRAIVCVPLPQTKAKWRKRRRERAREEYLWLWSKLSHSCTFGGDLGPMIPKKLRLNIFSQHFDHCHRLDIVTLCYYVRFQHNPMIFNRESGRKPHFSPIFTILPKFEPPHIFFFENSTSSLFSTP